MKMGEIPRGLDKKLDDNNRQNKGSVFGDTAGAPRYTEVRLSKFAEDVLLKEIKHGTVDYVKNYDNTEDEPLILPARYPISILNGTFGIAVGYSSGFPPHNIEEVTEQIKKRIHNPEHQIILTPDFPTGGVLINSEEVKELYTKGTSRGMLRAKIERDEKNHRLIITEIPYMKTSNTLKEGIQKVSKDRVENGKKIEKKIDGIQNILDESESNQVNTYESILNGIT